MPISFAPLHFPIFRGRPTTDLIGPRGEGAQAREARRSTLEWVGCSHTKKTFPFGT